MSQKKRSDKNSVTAALGGFKGAIESVPLPQGVELRSEELVIWGQFTRARAREDWRDMDLLLLAKVVRMEADIRSYQSQVEAQGTIVENQRGTQIPNPLLTIIDTVERRQLAVIRSMSLNQMASDPRTVNGYARATIDAGKTLESFSDNDLIAMPKTN
jgi:hypothetical protein